MCNNRVDNVSLKSVFYRIKSISKKDFKLGIFVYVLVSRRPFNRLLRTKFYRKTYMNHISKVYQKIQTPTRVDIEATNICNADCVFCPRHSHTRKQKIMDMELFKKIIGELTGIKTLREICLSGFGEPLLDKSLPEKIKYCKSKNSNWRTIIFSNGTYLDEDMSNKILDSGLDTNNLMNVTLDHFPPKIDLLFQLRELSERVIRNNSMSPDDKTRIVVIIGLIKSHTAEIPS